MRFLFLLGSSRSGGNTELLARRAAASLPAGVEQRWLHLADHPLTPFRDIRHDEQPYPQPTGNEALLLAETLAATDLVIASPLYWYSVSAATKLYLDHWSGWLRTPGVDFRQRMRGRRMWAISVLSNEDEAQADPLVATLRLSADYLDMRWGGVLLGHANRPGEVLHDTVALRAADAFFAPAQPEPAARDGRVAEPASC
ncbi:NAD(P)H-dependent oxidoreductase [Micromonospora peucetia]|uniref:flavodoxin family protein n=1 Tax=Micromonospora peucetia TaxID=47871 RepID=UPI00225729E8|nr:NAD(P)H-dependent oxidoreductase [Micromonospora peucetia]MCX4390779.1 NAD(P)H-dependent oxidoreductase [Micromonospora peucetia]